jgi:X-Pro dipeptidyl-peptidase
MKMMNRWFTRYLHGIENGVENDARSWIVREGEKRDNPTSYEDYPHPEASSVRLYLKGGTPGYGALIVNQEQNKGKETLVDNYSFDGSSLAKAEFTGHRLMYLSPALQNEIHLSGEVEVSISVASNKEAANLSVWLVSLPWNEGRGTKITDNIITRGWADPQNHKSISESEDLVPGAFYTVNFKLQPDDQIIPAGQQIGLMIFSSDREYTLWPEPGTELTIDLDKTSIVLPIVGGEGVFIQAIK